MRPRAALRGGFFTPGMRRRHVARASGLTDQNPAWSVNWGCMSVWRGLHVCRAGPDLQIKRLSLQAKTGYVCIPCISNPLFLLSFF